MMILKYHVFAKKKRSHIAHCTLNFEVSTPRRAQFKDTGKPKPETDVVPSNTAGLSGKNFWAPVVRSTTAMAQVSQVPGYGIGTGESLSTRAI